MPQAGWYPDPSTPRDPQSPVAYERWYDGQRWTATVRPAETSERPRRSPTLAFVGLVLAVLLVVGGAVAFLSRLDRSPESAAPPTGTVSAYDDSSPTTSATPSATPSAAVPTPSSRPEACDTVAPGRLPPADNDATRVGRGGLSMARIAGGWTAPYPESRMPYGRDAVAQAFVLPEKKSWAASANIGVTAFDEFPGLAPAASAMLTCVLTSDFYVSVSVKLAKSSSRSITVSGHRAVQLDATLTFSDPELTTHGSALRFVIVDTKPATFLFLATPVERQDLLDQADRTTASLRVF